MRKGKSKKSFNSRLTRWIDRLLPFDFTFVDLLGSKMGLVNFISRQRQQDAAIVSTYSEQFIIFKLDAIKCGAKSFLLIAKNGIDFASQKQQKMVQN